MPSVGSGSGSVLVKAEETPSPVVSRPGTANTLGRRGFDGGIPDGKSGLTQKSQSMGVSLRSDGSRSEYAAFI